MLFYVMVCYTKCYITYLMLYYVIQHMLNVMLYNMCYVMLYNLCYRMLYNMSYVMYIRYTTYVIGHNNIRYVI